MATPCTDFVINNLRETCPWPFLLKSISPPWLRNRALIPFCPIGACCGPSMIRSAIGIMTNRPVVAIVFCGMMQGARTSCDPTAPLRGMAEWRWLLRLSEKRAFATCLESEPLFPISGWTVSGRLNRHAYLNIKDERFEMKEGGGDQLGGWEQPIHRAMYGTVEFIASGTGDVRCDGSENLLSTSER